VRRFLPSSKRALVATPRMLRTRTGAAVVAAVLAVGVTGATATALDGSSARVIQATHNPGGVAAQAASGGASTASGQASGSGQDRRHRAGRPWRACPVPRTGRPLAVARSTPRATSARTTSARTRWSGTTHRTAATTSPASRSTRWRHLCQIRSWADRLEVPEVPVPRVHRRHLPHGAGAAGGAEVPGLQAR